MDEEEEETKTQPCRTAGSKTAEIRMTRVADELGGRDGNVAGVGARHCDDSVMKRGR
jgi:hypothetical protein